MCATQEGLAKGERWCKRAVWGNTLPAVKREWKSVDRLTSGAFVNVAGSHRRILCSLSSVNAAAAKGLRANSLRLPAPTHAPVPTSFHRGGVSATIGVQFPTRLETGRLLGLGGRIDLTISTGATLRPG